MDDNVFQALMSWQFALFCLGIAGVTFVVRKLVEFFVLDNPKMPGTRTSKFWRDLVLPVFPILFGGLMGGLLHKYPFPDSLPSVSSKIIFGIVAGLFSAQVYRLMNSFLKSKLGKANDGSSEAAAVGETINKD